MLIVLFSASSWIGTLMPQFWIGTLMPSSLMPQFANQFFRSEMLLVNSSTVYPYGSTIIAFRSYKYSRITTSCSTLTPKSPDKSCRCNKYIYQCTYIFCNIISVSNCKYHLFLERFKLRFPFHFWNMTNVLYLTTVNKLLNG